MKTTKTNQIHKLWLVLFCVLLSFAGYSQAVNHIQYTVTNCLTDTNKLDFEVYAKNIGTDPAALEAVGYQVAVTFNPASRKTT